MLVKNMGHHIVSNTKRKTKMGNIIDGFLTEQQLDTIAEGQCQYHGTKYMSEDKICLRCEKLTRSTQ